MQDEKIKLTCPTSILGDMGIAAAKVYVDTRPSQYRLKQMLNGSYVLQGFFSWHQGFSYGGDWEDIETIKELNDLGYSNGWDVTPDIVVKCTELGHELTQETVGNCNTEYTCPICRYKFRVDSSD